MELGNIINEINLNRKHECVTFKIKKSTYKIPSKTYPLNNRKFQIFNYDNTQEIDNNESLERLFNACKFQTGRCYLNTEMIYQGAKRMNINNVKYYSGWLFVGETPPVHHAWAVYNNNSILDGGVLQDMYSIIVEVNKCKAIKEEYARLCNERLKSTLENYKKYCFGKVVKPFVYIGCEDTMKHSLDMFGKTLDLFKGNHPSFNTPTMTGRELSEVQKMLIK